MKRLRQGGWGHGGSANKQKTHFARLSMGWVGEGGEMEMRRERKKVGGTKGGVEGGWGWEGIDTSRQGGGGEGLRNEIEKESSNLNNA